MKTIHSFQGFSMPKFWIMSMICILALSACNQEGDAPISPVVEEDYTELAFTVTETEEVFEEIEEIAIGVMEEVTENRPDERLSSPPTHLWRCAEVNRDSATKTITVDFGEGCEGPHGRVRSGKIIITYTARLYQPGASRTVRLDGYMVDSINIEGTRTITNTMTSRDDFVSMSYSLAGGKINWPDGSTATREVNRSKTWIRGANPLKDEYQIEGSVSGTTREGDDYSIEILEPMVYKRICHRNGVFIAVDGLKEVQRPGKETVSIDYGNGECDNLITISNGEESKEVDVVEQIRRRLREMKNKR